MANATVEIARVIRVGRGWADVEIDHKMRRISMRPDLLVRVGSYVKILNETGIAVLPASASHTSKKIQ